MENNIQRRNDLTKYLNKCCKAYYQGDNPIISDKQYDALYDELLILEDKYGALPDSPTQNVGYESVDTLEKIKHPSKMLSLDKTKDFNTLKKFLGDKIGILSYKEDGLTVVLTYENGELIQAVTRGNGEVGELITHNAKTFYNVPRHINYTGKLVLRGEAVISYKNFEEINKSLEQKREKTFKNPRNLASASSRLLDSRECAKRKVEWLCFDVVEGLEEYDSKYVKFKMLTEDMSIPTVSYGYVDKDNIEDRFNFFSDKAESYEYPVDGLVLTYNSVSYSKSLGSTVHHPLHSIAFKWKDETVETTLRDVEWSATRTSINPVAIFDPVEIDGVTVERASLHNVSIVQDLKLGIGDTITVYRANLVIPQVDENLTQSNTLVIPDKCSCCGHTTEIKKDNDSKMLVCTNPECPAKQLSLFVNFVSRDNMNIVGLSESTLDKLLGLGFIKEYADIYDLNTKVEQLKGLEGFGEKSVQKLLKSIDKSRKVEEPNILAALGIDKVGLPTARLICSKFTLEDIVNKHNDYTALDGIGSVISNNINKYMCVNKESVLRLISKLDIVKQEIDIESSINANISGKTFVITGDVHIYKNRKELTEEIIRLGGKVSSSVSSKTDYLVNNDSGSNSSKNKKAKELGIPILTEEGYIKLKEKY